MERQESWVRLRIRFVGFCFIVVFGLIAVRAFQLQVLSHEEWMKRAERQHQKIIPLAPKRGTIFDSNGEELALSIETDSVYVEPRKVVDSVREAKALAKALSLPYAVVKNKLESDKGFLWLKRQVSPRENEQVRSLGLESVNFLKEHKRYYPNSKIAAQVIGFAGLDPQGLEGVELKYDSLILGQGGYLVTERDALGREIGSGEYVVQGRSQGNNLYLTLDKNLQYIAEKELAAGVHKVQARAGTVVVLEPQTGKILAMASQPDDNPNAFYKYRPSQWRNRAICDTYEPGSTIKMFLLAAALNEGVIHQGQTINCEKGSFKVSGKVIHDHHPYDRLTVAEILKHSSNIGAVKIGKVLDRDLFYQYLGSFGFGAQTGIGLPGEVTGLVRKPSQWFEIDLAAISFGQGITVTPLQLALATAAIANGGYLMAPYVVERITDSHGELVERKKPHVVRRVISEDVASQIRDMMVMVTEKGGTGTLAAVPGFRVAGKTGTAQKVDPVTGGYSVDKRVSSFIGFVPAEAPRLVILVVVDEPEGQAYGGLVAAPIFSRIAFQSLRYLDVSPTQPDRREPFPPAVEAAVYPSLQPTPMTEVQEGAVLRMPDCTGMSCRQVLQAMGRTGINIKLIGNGRVIKQSPAAGRPIIYGNEVWVRLAPPA
jgi:cell division protein FtsI (penicillin-binding protein 3)